MITLLPIAQLCPEVSPCHQETIVADAGHGAGRCPPMNGDVFANVIAVANLDRAVPARLETQVLRPPADDRAVADLIVRP